jgi:hypothetical protein
MNENISGSEFTENHAATQPTPEGQRRLTRKGRRRRKPRPGPMPGGCAKKGRRIPSSASVGGMLPGSLSKSSRPSCGSGATQVAKSAVAPKPAVEPDQPSKLGVDSEWKCSLTPRVLRAHSEMDPLARRRFLKLLSDFASNIRNAGSHEEREMIMDRLAIAAVTFKKETACLAVSGRSGKRRKRVESKGRRTCRSWAAAQIAFGTLDLPSSSARWKVREAYLKFVEDHGIRPGHEALMSLTGLSAKCILGVLPASRKTWASLAAQSFRR